MRKEFRIGNIIGSDIHKYVIQEIKDSKVNLLRYDERYNAADIYKGYHKPYSECWPVPVTEEWLKRFGFKKDSNGHYSKPVFARIILRYSLIPYGFDLIQDGKEINLSWGACKYVHQLQNLCFALTQTELTLTTP